jgi:glycosyltransferase involved in cell wall biosynthesis
MTYFPIFLSVVFVLQNQSRDIQQTLNEATKAIASLVSDYEIIVVDNASNDESIAILKMLSGVDGLPNLQVYALTKEVDLDTATWIGMENALGDFIVSIDPVSDDINFLKEMLDKAVNGTDVVFASNTEILDKKTLYNFLSIAFDFFYKYFNGVNLSKEAPQYRVLSKRVVNFILQHPQPYIAYRHLPVTGGFIRANLSFRKASLIVRPKNLWKSVDRGIRLIVSTSRTPLRLATSIALFGAAINLIYSIYVLAVSFFKDDIAPGWISISLQLSGMFFLTSIFFVILGEYILNMLSLQTNGPTYYIGQEFTSTRMTRHDRLNIEENLEGINEDFKNINTSSS